MPLPRFTNIDIYKRYYEITKEESERIKQKEKQELRIKKLERIFEKKKI